MYTYDWASLDRETIFNILYSIKNEIISTPVKVNKVHSLLSKQIKEYLPVKIRKEFKKNMNKNTMLIGGRYYSEQDRNNRRSIELRFVYNSLDKSLKFTNKKFKKICITFADTILHEIIHMRQYRRRGFKELKGYHSTAKKSKQRQEQIYLGNTDEIGAYSFNIACELNDKFNGHKLKIINYLNNSNLERDRISEDWEMYIRVFDHNHNHRIIKRLKKRVMHYVSKNQLDKPFQTDDWICY